MPDRFVTIHGHFYQPPRENPWLEAVETQDAAAPYHDWNERITAECYRPNASARILDTRDRILRIVNNYASISFNFGPTLLSWLEAKAPDVYTAVIEADRASRERFSGHGSAIAQVYNHMILPLANARDKRTQVRWGVRDFEFRFGRKPEGMWLPETAADVASLEALAAEGIRFTILEPHQAARWRAIGETHWIEGSGALDPTMPYRCTLPSGRTIALFFYDGPISRAVAFEQLLARGENLAHRLVDAFDDTRRHVQNVNIATDGETYGHHHRYGEMALAYALHYIDERRFAGITNYAELLARHPPAHEVELVENTSWSCVHGVERWRSDCGCNAGAPAGWNQRWRAPLREALDWLRNETAILFESKGALMLHDPWNARDEYISVILDRSDESVQWFLDHHALPGASPTTVLELLEMQRCAMLMYTSCGWFFSDLSGIESVQVLNYAARAVQLAERHLDRPLEAHFMELLAAAQSNLPERGSGRQIYEREVLPNRIGLPRVAAHYAVSSLFDNFDDDAPIYCYRVSRNDFGIYRAGRARLAVGTLTVTSSITREEQAFEFAVLHLGETELTGGVRPASSEFEPLRAELIASFEPGNIAGAIRLLDRSFSENPVSLRSLFRDEQRRIFQLLCNTTLEEAESAFRQLHERYDPLMRLHARLGIPLPKVLQTAAEFDVNMQLRRLLEQDPLPLVRIESRIREAREEGVVIDQPTLAMIRDAVERVSKQMVARPEDVERLEDYDSVLDMVRSMQIDVDLRQPQNDYYRMMNTVRPVMEAGATNGRLREWLTLFDAIGEKLSFSPEARTS
jgi:alpha-amylase/alpha-mannosidase (GH57 family)